CDSEAMSSPFLRLLLQPLVENAIQHSIRDNFEKGKILISARREGKDMVIDIVDNGKGIPEETLLQLNRDMDHGGKPVHRGVGLRNVNDRLKLYFGDNYKLKIETGPEIGTKITLRHPILEEETLRGEVAEAVR
ncbi:sensor histidine kinase, partial [Paenibacillus sepulcri]|nr:sensor histidine kinase [Paenibacillus sepulcri]